MIKAVNTLAELKRDKQQILRQKQILAEKLRMSKLYADTAKSCRIGKPVDCTVNSDKIKTFRELDLTIDDNEWAPWSFVRRMQKKSAEKYKKPSSSIYC